MNDVIQVLFGEGSDLAIWQMADRAAVIFVLTLALIRISGRRSFGQHTPFDACITVLLGAVLSRAVTGASPFWATVGAATVLVAMHRAVALASLHWTWFERLVSGHEVQVLVAGKLDADRMREALITKNDLLEAVRKKMGSEDLAMVDRAVLERDGHITVVPAKSK